MQGVKVRENGVHQTQNCRFHLGEVFCKSHLDLLGDGGAELSYML